MKLVRYLPIAIAIIAILFIIACDNATAPEDEGDTEPDPFTYPHPDGAEWVYANDDDTMRYVIDGESTHQSDGTVQNLLVYEYDENEDDWVYLVTSHLLITDSEVRRYTDLDDDEYALLLKFPLEVGETWDLYPPSSNSTATVVFQDDVTVPAGTFEDCYIVAYKRRVGIDEFRNYVYYADGVGGTRGVMDANLDTEEVTRLESYNLPE